MMRHSSITFDRFELNLLREDHKLVFWTGGGEERGTSPVWRAAESVVPSRCVPIRRQTRESVTFGINAGEETVSLRDSAGLSRLLSVPSPVTIDLTGLPHHVWAPLVKQALFANDEVHCIYVEPAKYREHASPASESAFDLSSEVLGISPLPGFARLSGPPNDRESVLVAFLGFEGSRATQVATAMDQVKKVIPVVGVPGFRPEFPSHTVSCNRTFLEESGAYGSIRLADASCPFDALRELEGIRQDYPNDYLYLAPVGTKPHSLAAVIFALKHPTGTELVYDHPVRPAERTTGIGRTHLYRLKERPQ